MNLKKDKLGEILDVTRRAGLSDKFYATEGDYIRLTCGNFDYHNNCFKENKPKDNLYYISEFKSECLIEKGDIIAPLIKQAISLLGLLPLFPKVVSIFKTKMLQRINNYLKLVQDILRNFTNMKLFRGRVMNKEQCKTM